MKQITLYGCLLLLSGVLNGQNNTQVAHGGAPVAAVQSPNPLEDVLLVEGFYSATMRLQAIVANADGLREGTSYVVSKKAAKKRAIKDKAVVKAPKKVDGVAQENMNAFLQKYSVMLEHYNPVADNTTAPALFEQGIQIMIDMLRTPLLNQAAKDNLLKVLFPRLKMRPFNNNEESVWLAIRPITAPYEQSDGSVLYLHPLQDEALENLQDALAKLKTKQPHPLLVKRITAILQIVVQSIIVGYQPALLTRLASLEQIQQLAASISESDIISADTKSITRVALDRLISELSGLRGQASLLASQLSMDWNAALALRISNALQYMNRCDGMLKSLVGISSDAYGDESMQKLRNAFAQALVDIQAKVTPDIAPATIITLFQRATYTGLLGKAQREYVRTQMLPKSEGEVIKKAKEEAGRRLNKSSKKKHTKK